MKLFQVLNGIWAAIQIWKTVKPDVEPVVEQRRKAAEAKFKEEQRRKKEKASKK